MMMMSAAGEMRTSRTAKHALLERISRMIGGGCYEEGRESNVEF